MNDLSRKVSIAMVINAAFAAYRLAEIKAPPAAVMNHILKMAGFKKAYKNPQEAKADWGET